MNGASLTLDIVDTSGSYPFPAMRRLAISTADAFVLVYAIDDSDSFEEARCIHDQIVELRSAQAPVVVVGNKCDLSARYVSGVIDGYATQKTRTVLLRSL